MRQLGSGAYLVPCLLGALGLWPECAQAAPFSKEQRLYLSEGTLRGSPRLMGIAGAFVAIAEGGEGVTRNPASAASKDPRFHSDFDFDVGLAMHFLPPWAVREQDWDSDGRPDDVAGPVSFLGTQVLYISGALRYKNIGLGLGLDTQNFLNKTRREGESFLRVHALNLTHAFASLAASVWRDQILVGLGVETTHALWGYGEQPEGAFLPVPKEGLSYHGWGLLAGGLWRPENQNYRVGASFRPQVLGSPAAVRPSVGQLETFSEIAAPARLSFGAAWALGRGRAYNITSRSGWYAGSPENPIEERSRNSAMTKWLLTVQLDFFFPLAGATDVASVLEQPFLDAIPAGDRLLFQPRLAAEKELLADRLRLRLGTYWEPPMNARGPWVRPHLTFGGEVRLFSLGQTRIGFGLSFDFARLYQNLSVAFLVWQ